jgi:nicotinate-nucleotide adenylyltransferase
MRQGFPMASAGLRVGLLGGSFDPPHKGHLHISNWALKEFGLDQVWWLVSPGNPLKSQGPADLGRRMAACIDLVDHPRIKVTDLERKFGTRYTAETLEQIMGLYRDVRFVWLMGSDNLASFHKWDRWADIMEMVPVGVLARPGEQLAAGGSPAARRFSHARLSARRSTALPFKEAPCWSLVTGPMVDLSSSQIRARGDWPTD